MNAVFHFLKLLVATLPTNSRISSSTEMFNLSVDNGSVPALGIGRLPVLLSHQFWQYPEITQ